MNKEKIYELIQKLKTYQTTIPQGTLEIIDVIIELSEAIIEDYNPQAITEDEYGL